MARSDKVAARDACGNGHPWTEANTRRRRRRGDTGAVWYVRECRQCRRDQKSRAKRRRPRAAAPGQLEL